MPTYDNTAAADAVRSSSLFLILLFAEFPSAAVRPFLFASQSSALCSLGFLYHTRAKRALSFALPLTHCA